MPPPVDVAAEGRAMDRAAHTPQAVRVLNGREYVPPPVGLVATPTAQGAVVTTLSLPGAVPRPANAYDEL